MRFPPFVRLTRDDDNPRAHRGNAVQHGLGAAAGGTECASRFKRICGRRRAGRLKVF